MSETTGKLENKILCMLQQKYEQCCESKRAALSCAYFYSVTTFIAGNNLFGPPRAMSVVTGRGESTGQGGVFAPGSSSVTIDTVANTARKLSTH